MVAEAGRPYGIGPGSPNYIERIESGLVSYGADTDDASNPFELGLGRFIDIDQPHDFVGKQALQALREAGLKRRFMGLLIGGEPFAGTNESRWRLSWDDGRYAGYASATAYSPRAGSNIAVAMVSSEVIDAGAPVTVHTGTGDLDAKVVELPIIYAERRFQWSVDDRQIDGGVSAIALFCEFVRYPLAFVQTGEARILNRGDMYEHIIAVLIGIDKAIPFLGVKPFHSAL